MKDKLKLKLDNLIVSVHEDLLKKNFVVPIYEKGKIILGDVSIIQKDHTKNIIKNNSVIFEGVYLNRVAIFLANNLAVKRQVTIKQDFVYKQDQNYGVYMQEMMFFDKKYKQSLAKLNYDKADIYYARWQFSRDKALVSKRYVLSLISY